MEERTRKGEQTYFNYLVLLLVALVCAGCSGQPSGSAAPPTAAPGAPTTAATTAAQSSSPEPTTAVASTETFQNPVFQRDFPDPDIIKVGDDYYAYATNSSSAHIQVARSKDLVTWQLLADGLPQLPAWAQVAGLFVWAPEVMQLGDRFVMYFTARDRESGKQCIGVATSDKADGAFRDTNDKALVCQADQGGSIDPSPFQDGEKLYLYWKNDGNCCGQPTFIYVQELAPDGLSLVGEPKQLIGNDAFWEGNLVEAPTMFKHDNSYFLFFSANAYDSPNYGVGYATCQSVTGPCSDARENPILKSRMMQRPNVIGPGHQTLVQIGDTTWIVYHAWEVTPQGTRGSRRFMWMDRIEWQDDKPHVDGPTTDPQPAPL